MDHQFKLIDESEFNRAVHNTYKLIFDAIEDKRDLDSSVDLIIDNPDTLLFLVDPLNIVDSLTASTLDNMIKYFEEIEQYEKCNKLLIIKKLLINKFNRNPNNEKYSGVIGESVLYELKKNEKKTDDRTGKRN